MGVAAAAAAARLICSDFPTNIMLLLFQIAFLFALAETQGNVCIYAATQTLRMGSNTFRTGNIE